MARHDVRRTGAAAGTSNLRTPGAYWRSFLGGQVGLAQAAPLEIMGQRAIAFVSAGSLQASDLDGTRLWSTGNLALSVIEGIADLDGDGGLEVVARSSSQVFAFSAATGELRWAEDEGEMGTIGGVRVADVDGNGLADIVVQECMCCQLRSGETGFVYGFAQGFAAPARLWRLPDAYCAGSRSMIVDDFDGDGNPDLTIGNRDFIMIASGQTGQIVASTPDLGTWTAAAWCEPVDLDGVGGKEIICALGTPLADPGTGHRVFALRHETEPSRLDVMWSVDVGVRDEELGLGLELVHDLDHDGLPEVVVSGSLATGTPVTLVLDARSGAVLATLVGEAVVGPAAVDASSSLLLTRAEDQLSAWRFVRAAPTPLQFAWLVKYRRPLTIRDWSLAGQRPRSGRLALEDVDLDGQNEVLSINTETPSELVAHSLASPTGATLRYWQAVEGSALLAGWPFANGDLTVSTSDGRLTVLDTALTSVLGRVRAGGYHDAGGWLHLPWAPVSGDLDGDGADEVLMTDSRKTLLALDARVATNAGPPAHLWQSALSFAPSIIPGLTGGGPGIACRKSVPNAVPARELVSVLDATGTSRWEAPIGDLAFNDVVTGNFDGDGVPDLAVQWGDPADTAVQTAAFSGATGTLLWNQVTQAGETRIPSGVAAADWNGDGIDDVTFHHYGVRVLSGVDGAEVANSGASTQQYFLPTLTDVDGNGSLEVSLSGGFYPSRTLSADLSTNVWASTDDDRPYPYAAVATCPASTVLIGGSLAQPSRLKVTLQAGATPGTWQSVVLAGGARYADLAAATAAGAQGGQLTSVHVHANLTGLGHPSAVVGSSDGWLYAVDPCTMALDWALPFGVPVGAVAFGDRDGDGLDEIVVSTADGYLHGVQHAPLPAPDEVRDNDPSGDPAIDIDVLDSRGALAASWSAVEGAIGYEVAVALDEGGIITSPQWQRVESTFVTFAGLPIEDGVRYVVAVRALADEGPSPDTLSDGVLIRLTPAVDAGPGSDAGPGVEQPGGCCSAAGGRASATMLLAALLAVVLRRRPRRRRR